MSVLELDSHSTVYCIVPICCAYRHSVGTVNKASYALSFLQLNTAALNDVIAMVKAWMAQKKVQKILTHIHDS